MDEYIKREQVLTELENATSWTDLGIRIDSIPAADVVERKTGQWIPIKEETGVEAFGFKEKAVVAFRCSTCDKEVDVSEGNFNFCPNCGARMIGGDDDG